MKVRIIPHLRANAAWNLALEEAAFLEAKKQLKIFGVFNPIIRLYSFSKPSVVLGYQQRISDIDLEYCQDNKVDVTMRTTGGGSVFLGKNDLQYSIIMPVHYTKHLLSYINNKIVSGINNLGFESEIKNKDGHDIVRLKERGFVFDAQRRAFVKGFNDQMKPLLLHHGTILIDNSDYDHMPQALKASKKELEILKNGNIWLRDEAQIKEQEMIRSLQETLPPNFEIAKGNFTKDEISLAKKLYASSYNRTESFKDGKKKYGICYKTDSPYNMEQYAVKEMMHNG